MKRNSEQGNEDYEPPKKCISRCIWTEAEDKALREMAEKYQGEYWNIVAKYVGEFTPVGENHKSAKQCRERWHNQLNPKVCLGPLSTAEEKKVLALHQKYGNKWSKIAGKMPGRTDNVIKNYFLCRLRKIVRSIKKNKGESLIPKTELEIEQALYLLDYLYKYYISPERQANIRKTLTSQIKRRRNCGDKYINRMVEEEGISAEKLSAFMRSLATASPSTLKMAKFSAYAYLLDLAPNDSSQISSSSVCSSNSRPEDPKSSTFSSAARTNPRSVTKNRYCFERFSQKI